MPKGTDKTTRRGKKPDQIYSCATDGVSTRNYYCATRTFPALAAAAAALCVLSLLIAYFYMERYLLLEPCPLCILDRFAVGGMAAGFALLAWARRGALAWGAWGWTTLMLAAGWVFALRHIWLQNRPPDESAACLSDAAAAEELIALVQQAFSAKADCGAIMWEFAGMTIPEQVVVLLAVLSAVHLWLAAALWRGGRA